MNKIAQRRGLLNQLREKVNAPGSYLEGLFKPELDRVMISLKEIDDRIRAILSGTKIGDAEAPEDTISAKDLLKSAKSKFNRREYMTGVADLGRFHKKMWEVSKDIGNFLVDVNKIHHKFLFEGLKDKDQEHVKKLREHMETLQKKSDIVETYFIKEANILDFLYNVRTTRGRSLAAWEKKYGKQIKDLKEGGEKLIADAQRLLDNTLSYLKQMATARAVRRPDEYVEIANKIKAEFNRFDSGDKGFRNYYNTAVVPWLKIKDEVEAKENAAPAPAVPANKEVPDLNVPAAKPPVSNAPAVPPGASPPFPPTPAEEEKKEEEKDTEEEKKEEEKDTDPTIKVAPAHQRFYQSLQSLGNENPLILAKYIAKYAASIQHSDPGTAIDLLKIVKKIKG
jgi:hypothetical protein